MKKRPFNLPPLKFEAGTPHIAGVVGLGCALDYLNSVGREGILEWEKRLLDYGTQRMEEIKGMRIIGTAQEKGCLISFVIEGLHPLDFGTMLGFKGIAIRTGHLCAQPLLRRFGLHALARISFGMYNTFEEIDLFIHSLEEITSLLAPV